MNKCPDIILSMHIQILVLRHTLKDKMIYKISFAHCSLAIFLLRITQHIIIFSEIYFITTYFFSIVKCKLRLLGWKKILGKTKTKILIRTTPISPLGRNKHKNIDYDQLRNPCDKKSARKYDAGR